MAPAGSKRGRRTESEVEAQSACGAASFDDGETAASSAAPSRKRRRGKVTLCGLCEVPLVRESSDEGTGEMLCKTCADFAAAKPQAVGALLAVKKKGGSAAEKQAKQLAEHRASAEDPAGRTFKPEKLFLRVTSGSRVQESHEFLSRTDFKTRYNMFPEQAKILQAKVTNFRGEEVQGVIIRKPTNPLPELMVWTQREWVRHVPVMGADAHLYEEQGEERWHATVADKQRNMGQDIGGKYVPKTKNLQPYDPDRWGLTYSRVTDHILISVFSLPVQTSVVVRRYLPIGIRCFGFLRHMVQLVWGVSRKAVGRAGGA